MRTVKFIFPVGLPASGKSTWVREEVSRLSNEEGVACKIYSYDLYRKQVPYRDMTDIQKRENLIKEQLRTDLRNLLAAYGRKDVLADAHTFYIFIDNTNLSEKSVSKLTHFINTTCEELQKEAEDPWQHCFEFNWSFLDVDLHTCLIRDEEREGRVGPKVILRMYNQHVTKIKRGDIDAKRKAFAQQLWWAKFDAPAHAKHTIVVDIDGTLALMGNRSPYDGSKYYGDKVNHPVAHLVENWVAGQIMQGLNAHVVFLSGREATEEGVRGTRQWLEDFFLPQIWAVEEEGEFRKEDHPEYPRYGEFTWELHMRNEGDHRPDNVVKEEMFDGLGIWPSEDLEYVLYFILDDRDQVVNMWRSKGLPCFQVGPGNF